MASMSTLFVKPPYPSHSFSPKPLHTHFSTPLKSFVSLFSKTKTHQNAQISCGLIEPDGGKLVELFVKKSQQNGKQREAILMPRIKLSRIDLQWVHVLSEGWASPLREFIRESEFLQTLHFNSLRLDDGFVVNMSVLIVLPMDDSQRIGSVSQKTDRSSKSALNLIGLSLSRILNWGNTEGSSPNASSMSYFSSLHKRVVSGLSSKFTKVEPTEIERFLA